MVENIDREKPDECEACHFVMDALVFYKPFHGSSATAGKWLCDLCAGTSSGSAIDYPHLYRDNADSILHAICYVGNAIIKAIDESGTPRKGKGKR